MKGKDIVLNNVGRRENVFLTRVYLKMTGALVLTALVAYLVSMSAQLMHYVVLNPISMVILAIAQIGLVIYLSSRVEHMSKSAASLCFAGYAVLTGVTFSTIFTVYVGTGVITKAFVSSAIVFALASVYGTVTKKSIKGWGGWLMMSLVGIIIASLVNLLLRSTMLDLMISAIGVLVFTLLTAWDSQKLCKMNAMYGSSMSEDELSKISVMGALDLYLDFINIFLYFIRIFARSNDR